tara:strand:+ start:727 stop:957 length:231 start_codon:yes stop_codon:yes gene_type:complete
MKIKIYGADWCIDCIHVKEFLDSKKIQYQYIDISKNNEALLYVEKVNKGKRVIPTLIFNNVTYINPGIKKLNNLIK